MTIFRESKGWDSESQIFNRWSLVPTLAFNRLQAICLPRHIRKNNTQRQRIHFKWPYGSLWVFAWPIIGKYHPHDQHMMCSLSCKALNRGKTLNGIVS